MCESVHNNFRDGAGHSELIRAHSTITERQLRISMEKLNTENCQDYIQLRQNTLYRWKGITYV